MTNRRNLLELLVLASCVFALSGAITTLTLTPGATVLEGNAIGQVILSVSYLAVGAMLVRYHRETLFLVRRNWTLLAMVILAFTSCLWAETPAFTFRPSVAVAGTPLLGIALAVRLPLESQLRMLSWVYRIISVLSIACVVLLPSYGISSSAEQRLRGVLSHKTGFSTGSPCFYLLFCRFSPDRSRPCCLSPAHSCSSKSTRSQSCVCECPCMQPVWSFC